MLDSLKRAMKVGAAAGLLTATALFPAITSAQSTPQPLTRAQILAALDPQMLQVVMLYDAIKGTPIIYLTPQDARQQLGAEDAAKIIVRGVDSQPAPQAVGKVVDGMTITGQDGNQIPIRIYYPVGNGPFPVTVYFHGGGFVLATIDTYDASARALCNYSNSIVVSVEYRKAPEASYPAAPHDAISAYRWVVANATSANNAIAGKVAVAGESAGANLATLVAIAARDQGLQKPTHQLLIYPVVSGNLNQPSDIMYNDRVLPLWTDALPYYFNNYVPYYVSPQDPQLAPYYANLQGLPPTTIIAAELDPLRSDGEAYAAKLTAAKVSVSYQLYSGTTHEFFGMGAYVDKAKAAEQYAGAQLAASFK